MCSEVADIEPGEADLDLVRDLGRVTDQFELVTHLVQHAAAMHAAAFLLADEADRHRDLDARMLPDAQEIDMERPIGNRMELHVLGQGAGLLAGDIDHHHGIHEVAVAHHLDEPLFLDVDRDGRLIGTIDDGWNATFATHRTGGSLACPLARLGRQVEHFAHVDSPKTWLANFRRARLQG
jgi:hypothetical protein